MFYTLLALADTPATKDATPDANPFSMLPLLMGIAVMGYFLLWRPVKKQEQERQSLLNSLKKNDKVITHAGIYGTIVSVAEKEDEIVVKVDDNVRLKMIKASIMKNLTNEEAAKEAKEKGKLGSTPDKAADDKPSSTAITKG
jgi:preprotein translocase subunit YajC